MYLEYTELIILRIAKQIWNRS